VSGQSPKSGASLRISQPFEVDESVSTGVSGPNQKAGESPRTLQPFQIDENVRTGMSGKSPKSRFLTQNISQPV
jgi:hypothetical protein